VQFQLGLFSDTGDLFTGICERNAATFSGFTIVRPSGFLKSDAIFATSFDGATPTEQDSPRVVRIIVLICPASNSAAEKLPTGLKSRNASSILTCSNRKQKERSMVIISEEILAYKGKFGGKNIA